METGSVIEKKKSNEMLDRIYSDTNQYELSIDEAGRGCLFGRVYIACVVLPKEQELFNGKDIKDSKKFTSKKKLNDVADYIKQNALAWHISYIDEKTIDEINILQATMQGMHNCIREVISKLETKDSNLNLRNCSAVIDGNYFNPYRWFDKTSQTICELPHVTVEKGDGKYMGIAAASILAKTARDNYVIELSNQYPALEERYGLTTNMGYGTKKHLAGIKEHGITNLHRRTFGCCKEAFLYDITPVSLS
jgi:ribonuclease HII